MKLYLTRPLNQEFALKGLKSLSLWKNPPTWDASSSSWKGTLVQDPAILSNRCFMSKVNDLCYWSICPKGTPKDKAVEWLYQVNEEKPQYTNLSLFIWDFKNSLSKERDCQIPYQEFMLELDLSHFEVCLYNYNVQMERQ